MTENGASQTGSIETGTGPGQPRKPLHSWHDDRWPWWDGLRSRLLRSQPGKLARLHEKTTERPCSCAFRHRDPCRVGAKRCRFRATGPRGCGSIAGRRQV